MKRYMIFKKRGRKYIELGTVQGANVKQAAARFERGGCSTNPNPGVYFIVRGTYEERVVIKK